MPYKSSAYWKRVFNSTINRGKKYDKIYHGKYEAERDTSIYDGDYNKTFVNYGIVSNYCDFHKVLHHKSISLNSMPLAFISARCRLNIKGNCELMKVRLMGGEFKTIKERNGFVPLYLRQKIKSREL